MSKLLITRYHNQLDEGINTAERAMKLQIHLLNSYKFEDYKEQVIDLLKRLCNVRVKAMDIIIQMPNAHYAGII